MKALATLLLVVSSGDYDRFDTLILFPCTLADLGLSPNDEGFVLVEQGVEDPKPIFFQFTHDGRMAWILPGKTPKGTRRTFRLTRLPRDAKLPPLAVRLDVLDDGERLQLNCGDKPILRYNHGAVTQFPDKPSKYDRAGYFHPLWAPSGEVITGDFHPDHAHHRGLWFAWVKAEAGPIKANFWEIQEGRGEFAKKALSFAEGLVFASFAANHDLMSGGKVLLKETLWARAYSAPAGLRMIDLDVRHEATDEDVVLGKMHYGGLGFRGRDEWNEKGAALDVLTSEGKTRKDANATKARWIDYTGRLGQEGWGGLLAIEHPSNPRYPNGVRVHPSMAFFSSTLVQSEPYTIKKGEPLVLRYRLVIHDGKPDKALAERLAADFASPPTVKLTRQD